MKTVKFISIALAGTLLVLSACKKDNSKEPEPEIDPTSERCKASDYPQVTIGTQIWMAENYRCSKYDTQSEAYNASWLTNNTIPTSKNYTYTPYYTDALDKSKWNKELDYSDNLTDAQVAKLGYLYNWAAAVGVDDGRNQTIAFSGKRQGICPNGWHIPSMAEFKTLEDYIERTDGRGTGTAGKYLKTTSGWYSGGNGLDRYGFAALPAGVEAFGGVNNVGNLADFWSATLNARASAFAYGRSLRYSNNSLEEYNGGKEGKRSVRCLKD